MITQDSIQFGTTQIRYDIIYSSRKNATLAVYPLKEVEITVPASLEREHIQNLVRKKAKWVIKQIMWFDEITQIDSTKEYVNGETFLYLGRQYRLKIKKENGRSKASLIGKYLTATLPELSPQKETKKIIKAVIWRWYSEHARKKVEESIKYYSRRLGIEEPKFIIKNQSKRWGSCTSKNILNFNFRIAMAPVSQLNYIVAHELCHIKIKDHSSQFWKILQSVMPDYAERKERLRKAGWQYVL